jgi:hypothetical protein
MIGSCCNGMGATRESDINFRVGSMVYSSRNKQSGIVVTRDEYGRNKMINNAQTPVYFPKGKKVVAVYNRYLESLDDRIGAAMKLTKAQEFWIKRMGTKEFPLTEPFGSLWKPRGKKIYVEKKKNDTSAYRIIKSLNWVDNVQEAGQTAMLVTLK